MIQPLLSFSEPDVKQRKVFVVRKDISAENDAFSPVRYPSLVQKLNIEAVLESILISASLLGENKIHMLWRHADCSPFISKKVKD